MADVTIIMTVDTVALAEAVRAGTTPNLGSIITHTVQGGSLTKDPTDPNNSTKDIISVMVNNTINIKLAPKDGDITNPAKTCSFINFGVKQGSLTFVRNILQASGNGGGGTERQINAAAGNVAGTMSYFITFTINNHQFTFDPKLQVKIPTPM